jgi:hypothetical protein
MIASSRGPKLNTSIVLPHALHCARGAGPTARGALLSLALFWELLRARRGPERDLCERRSDGLTKRSAAGTGLSQKTNPGACSRSCSNANLFTPQRGGRLLAQRSADRPPCCRPIRAYGSACLDKFIGTTQRRCLSTRARHHSNKETNAQCHGDSDERTLLSFFGDLV